MIILLQEYHSMNQNLKQALGKLHSKVSPKTKPLQLASFLKQGLSYQPPFFDAIAFVNKFYQLVPPVWMNTFSDAQLMKLLITQTKVQYISILLKYSQVDPYTLKSAVEKRFTKEFYSFQKEIAVYKMADQDKVLALVQQNTAKIDYLFNFAVRWMSLDVEVNLIIRWLMLVHPTEKSHHDLINMLVNEIITEKNKIKWDEFYNMCTLKLNGAGNISTLFARLPISSSEISQKLYPSIFNSTFPVSSFIKIMMNYSCPTKVIEITESIIKRLAADSRIKQIEDIFNNFCKPVLIKHMATSIYYMEFDKIMRCLMEIKEAKYSFTAEEITNILSKLNCYKPKEHLKLMEDLFARYSPESRIRLQNSKESLLYQSKIQKESTETAQIKLKKKDSFENDKQLIMECQNLIGLPNIGNSCYMNSLIMCLYFCSEFFKAITPNQFKNKTLAYLRQIFFCISKKESQNLIKMILHFKATLPPDFSNNIEQQDAMDFGRTLLSCIIENQPKIGHLFQSKFHQVLICPSGDIHSKTTITQNHLILNFSNPQVFASMIKSHQMPQGIMLQQLLTNWFQPVTLDNNYTCSKCNKPFKTIKKQMYLSKLPKILILCISRFAYNLKSKKILDKIITKEVLKISQENTRKTYKLVSFLNHMGSTSNSGHYQAYVSNHQHSWINFDDDYVTEISVKNNVDLFNNFNTYDTPYILFYEQFEEKDKV